MDCSPPGSSVFRDFSGKNTGLRCHFLLQGSFPDQGSNPYLLHWQVDSLPTWEIQRSQLSGSTFLETQLDSAECPFDLLVLVSLKVDLIWGQSSNGGGLLTTLIKDFMNHQNVLGNRE